VETAITGSGHLALTNSDSRLLDNDDQKWLRWCSLIVGSVCRSKRRPGMRSQTTRPNAISSENIDAAEGLAFQAITQQRIVQSGADTQQWCYSNATRPVITIHHRLRVKRRQALYYKNAFFSRITNDIDTDRMRAKTLKVATINIWRLLFLSYWTVYQYYKSILGLYRIRRAFTTKNSVIMHWRGWWCAVAAQTSDAQ